MLLTQETRFRAVPKAMGALLAALLMIGASAVTAPAAHAAPVTQDGFTFETDVNGTATVTGYTGPATTLIIPATITHIGTDYAVTTIGKEAFRRTPLTSVTIPDSVTTIDGFAFEGTLLNTVAIGNSVTTIGDFSFAGTPLATVTIPDSVITISRSAFFRTRLTSVTIPDSVTTIGQLAFHSTPLTSVTIGNSVTIIGDFSFAGTPLTSVTIPDSVTTIDVAAFADSRLTSVTIGNSVTTIGEAAFAGTPLTSVTIPDSVTTIGKGAFRNTALTTVTIPDSVTTIREDAFTETALTSAVFQGAPPTVFTVNGLTGSLGDDPGVTVYYPPAFAASYAPGGATTWQGYAAAPWPTVAFNLGGQGTGIADVTLFPGDPAPTPAAPTAAGVTFAGWFTASTGGTAFDFTAPRFTDTTAFAQWRSTSPAATLPPTGTNPAPLVGGGMLALLAGTLALFLARRRQALPDRC